jgi:hypothetical protein
MTALALQETTQMDQFDPLLHSKPKIFLPKNEADWQRMRESTIGSTESPSLLPRPEWLPIDPDEPEDHRWSTPYNMWAVKSGLVTRMFKTNERMEIGKALEDSIANLAAKKLGTRVYRDTRYYMHSAVPRMGCSVDYRTVDDNTIVECKNISIETWYRMWLGPDGARVPAHILMQVFHQLAVLGEQKAYISVLLGGSQHFLFIVEQQNDIAHSIIAAIQDFWHAVDTKTPPEIDAIEDRGIISRLTEAATPRLPTADFSADITIDGLCAEYIASAAAEKQAKATNDAAFSKLIIAMGQNAEAFTKGHWIRATSVYAEGKAHYRKLTVKPKTEPTEKRSRRKPKPKSEEHPDE